MRNIIIFIKAIIASCTANTELRKITQGTDLTPRASNTLSTAFSALSPKQIAKLKCIGSLSREQFLSILSETTLNEIDREEAKLRFLEVKFYSDLKRFREREKVHK